MISASDMRRGFGQGVPLTPLMAKLTMLANETQTPIANTPSSSKIKNPFSVLQPSTSKKEKDKKEGEDSEDEDIDDKSNSDKKENLELTEAVLFVFGNNSTSIMLIMEPDSSQDPDQIHSLVSTPILLKVNIICTLSKSTLPLL